MLLPLWKRIILTSCGRRGLIWGVSEWIGYKEWEGVCSALAEGRQHLLLRKGGIHEGRAGFSFKHEEFVLFPTRFHAQGDQVRERVEISGGEWEVGDEVPLSFYAKASWACTLTDWEAVRRLEPYHIWSEELVRERFEWGEDSSIHCALVRVSRANEDWKLTYEKKYGGCRTWVRLPEPSDGWQESLSPVLPDEEFRKVSETIFEICHQPS